MRKYIIFATFCFSSILQAQQTGSFVLNVQFEETDYNENRNLYYFVPEDYDENKQYQLVVGYRGGPHSNAGEFRDQLQFLSDEIGAIILCPENEAHFWNNEGLTKQLFQYSLDTTMSMYSIDPEYIYLTGLSYGGRHAVITAFDTDYGAIPALRGVIPFATGSEGDLQPNYEAINQFAPACICIGLNDSNNFINVANNLHNDIIAAGGNSFLNEIPGVGHTVEFASFPDEMMECIKFIEDVYITNVPKIFATDISLNITPNPVKDSFQFISNEEYPRSSFQIIDVSRKTVKSGTVKKDVSYDISTLPSGTYFIKTRIEGHSYTLKMIKQ